MPIYIDPIVPLDTVTTLINDGLLPLLGYLQKIEVFHEVGNIRSASSVEFAYPNWRSAVVPQVLYNREFVTTGYTVNYTTGTLAFTTALADGDEVRCSYGFQYFTDADLANFLEMALATINNQRPQTSFTFDDSIPDQWFTQLVELSYAHALETVIQDLITWKAALIWRDPKILMGAMQAVIARLWASWAREKRELKGRKYLVPQAVASGRWRAPRAVTGSNWQNFTVIRS